MNVTTVEDESFSYIDGTTSKQLPEDFLVRE
jgi:hypothetical protein